MDALLAIQKILDEHLALTEENMRLTEEIEAMKLMLRPAAIPPYAETPVRQVTGVELPEERE